MNTKHIAVGVGALVLAAAGYVAVRTEPPASPAESKAGITKAEYYRWYKEDSNWGRWGKEDELGTVNLITPEKRKQAAALVKSGVTVSLAELQVPNGLDKADPNTAAPFQATWTFKEGWEQSAANDPWNSAPPESLTLGAHGSRSHIDSLAHNFKAGQFYNGFSWKEMTKDGAKKLGMQNMRNGNVTRGTVMDIPRLKGVPYLKVSEYITVADLEAWEKKAGVRVSSGDAIFIHAGNWARRRALGEKTPAGRDFAGLAPQTAHWLRQRDVAVIGTDGAIDAMPSGFTGKG